MRGCQNASQHSKAPGRCDTSCRSCRNLSPLQPAAFCTGTWAEGVGTMMELNFIRERHLNTTSHASSCTITCGPNDMLNEALNDRYRCPEGFFESVLAGP